MRNAPRAPGLNFTPPLFRPVNHTKMYPNDPRTPQNAHLIMLYLNIKYSSLVVYTTDSARGGGGRKVGGEEGRAGNRGGLAKQEKIRRHFFCTAKKNSGHVRNPTGDASPASLHVPRVNAAAQWWIRCLVGGKKTHNSMILNNNGHE